ncbi:hypothetical protein K438DRAFT_923652 [Mycena galopus ATCC 62051]|nr:hypothetical protein K438DRAFT_923652 [Mycena galopus ATCC 62051]
MSESALNHTCATCHKPETQDLKHSKCARCHKAAYCSKECQKRDWSAHKQTCELRLETHQCLFKESALGTKVRDTLSDLEKWVSKRTQCLAYAAINAMELHNRANIPMIKTHLLVVVLEPAPSGVRGAFIYNFCALRETADGVTAAARAALANIPDEGGLDRYRIVTQVCSGTTVYLATISVDLGPAIVRYGPPNKDWKGFLERAINKTLNTNDELISNLLHGRC